MESAHDGIGVREEAINTKLAQLLSEGGTLHIPESIFSSSGRRQRRLPDIFAEYSGVRVILEARFVKNERERKKLENDCQERIEEGLAAITIGIIYPPDLRKNWDIIEQALQKSPLKVRVFSENG